MTEYVHVEPLGGHAYVIRAGEGEEQVEIQIQASLGVVQRLGLRDTDEPRVVQATAAFLLERQLAVDLPSTFDLDDVAAGYDNYLSELERSLSQ
jgi:hypothetical protein